MSSVSRVGETKRSRSWEMKPLIFKLSKRQVWLLELCVFQLAVPDPARLCPGCWLLPAAAVYWK